MTAPTLYLSAGEPSGDRLGARLAAAIRAAAPDARLEGMGGPCMRAAGVELLHDATPLAAHGLAEAAASLPAHYRLLRDVTRAFRAGRYAAAVFIDYPGFHLAAAGAARAAAVPSLQYVAPQLWAWGGWRADRLRRRLDRLAVILPFEEPFFRRRGVDARFVGHPLLDEAPPGRAGARAALGIGPADKVLALFPGSRRGEVDRLWPAFRDAARQLSRERNDLAVVTAALPGMRYPGAQGIRLHTGDPAGVLAAADAALCKAGTSSLEAALASVPHAVAYRAHPVTWAAARRLVGVRSVSLANLLLDAPAVPELLQSHATAAALAAVARPMLSGDPQATAPQLEAFARVRERLGSPGAAGRVAGMALELVA